MTRSKHTFQVCFHDAHTLLIDKPPGMVVENPSHSHEPSLKAAVQKQFPGARPVHRIDKDTSGLVLWALSDEAYRYYSTLFQQRQVGKVYHAIVCGRISTGTQTIDLPLMRTASGKGRVSHRYGRPAQTTVEPIERFRRFSLVQCAPLTGRYHQIRIHLSSIGLPIAGDVLYGGCVPRLSEIKRNYKPKAHREEPPLIGRTALHAYALRLVPYGRAEAMEWTAPYPKDFRSFLTKLRKYDQWDAFSR